MYAIVDIAGQQFKVEKDNRMFVHRLEDKEGSQVNFDNVLLIDNNGKITIGEPTINGACVVAKVVSHLKGDKVLVFKKKRRKGYQVLNGHRQYFTEVIIEDIVEKGFIAKAPAEKKEAKAAETKTTKKPETKAEQKEVAPKKETKSAEKKEAPKKEASSTAKKAAPKKTTAKAAPKTKTATKPAAKKAAPKKETKSAAKKTTGKDTE